jgi:nitrogen fixation protein NifX
MAYRIAITSSDGVNIDTHFGQSGGFYILEAADDGKSWETLGYRNVPKTAETASGAAEQSCNGHDDARLAVISSMLSDCQYLLTKKIGLKPYRFLQRTGLTSLELSGSIAPIIEKLTAYHHHNRLHRRQA